MPAGMFPDGAWGGPGCALVPVLGLSGRAGGFC